MTTGFATGSQTTVTLVPELLDDAALNTPGSRAAEDPQRTLTYQELRAEAWHLAGRLVESGVRPEDRVGVMMRHSTDLLVAVLGVLIAGAAYVPIDVEYPRRRQEFLAENSEIRLLITDTSPGPIPAVDVPTLSPDRGRSDKAPNVQTPGPDDVACVIYTSGSTGQPKGVMLTHLGLANLAAAASDEFAMDQGDRYLMLAAAAFSASLEELFPPLVKGATCVFPADRAALSPIHALLDYIESRHVTLVEMQTAHWHLLVRHLTDTGEALPSSLKLIIMGGDRPLPEMVRNWDRFRVGLVHVYGPTETTATATYWQPADKQMPEDGILPIGDAIINTTIHIVDERLDPVAAGDEGELLVGGLSLARGYLGRPDATAERFVADRYSDVPGARLYRTGDRVRRLPDGRLQFLGRGDYQVKVRGYRVEPGEIETALGRHPAVRQATVTVQTDDSGDRRLAAYVAADAAAVTLVELRAHLISELPAHLVPSVLVRLDELPMTVHRKIDVAALPAPPRRRPDQATEFVPPADDRELRLASAAAELLGLDEVGVVDDLLELGGDSLFMLRLISWIRKNLGVSLGLREVFADYHIRGIARLAAAAADALDGDR
ncbi:non-ribosomal peptide synthetase [Catenulispora pinisilvae]|uniref:non-ribosomal peptide synthetase n=1 Tax=Catenulispora pinisilvae TaxID=2705253 RepID=UPI0018915EF5|nr:non-ribosomal peptide synthetase [Catenulispora pinisilvae]